MATDTLFLKYTPAVERFAFTTGQAVDESKDSSSSTERSEGEEENEVLFASLTS